jgi:outer membrane protein TolC
MDRRERARTATSTCLLVWSIIMATPRSAAGQQAPPPQPLRLDAAIDLALKNYPAIRAAEAQATVARASVDVARTAYLPRTDLLWQENLATRNNVAGLLLPQGVIPSVSGPVTSPASYGALSGSAAGVLLSWEPFDFGVRHANVSAANGVVTQATASLQLTELQVAVAAADTFLNALAADETVRAAQASLDRLQVLNTAVTTLVQNQLRPGADASRVDAEVASARIQLYRSQRAATLAHAALADAIGLAGVDLTIEAGPLLQRAPAGPLPAPAGVDTHPAMLARQAAVDTARQREQVLAHAYVPRVTFQTALASRGAPAVGATGIGGGFFPDTTNWAMGLTFTFPVFDFANVRARRQIEAGNEAVERAQLDRTEQAIRTAETRARADFDAARQIAATTPVALDAARQAETQIRARYDAGLATLTEVADAQRLLTQAEIDDRLARLGLWQALLAQASAHGDLAPFLGQVK